MFVLGLTGGIGSGKTVVGQCFADQGIKVVDADQMARRVVEPGMPALAEISERFGKELLLEDGSLNRAALREIIFQDKDHKIWLESVLHPKIRELTHNELQSAESPYAILESPLLLEMNQDTQVNRVLVVDVPESVQIARASKRDNNSKRQIRAIIDSQISRTDRLARADDILLNNQSIAALHQQVMALHKQYLQQALQL